MTAKALISMFVILASPLPGACQRRPSAADSVPGHGSERRVPDRAAATSLLVDVQEVDSTFRTEVRYATDNNFTGQPLPGYEAPRVLLRREVAQALSRVQSRLRSGGFALLIFDGYRPVRATIAMVDWAKRTGRSDLVRNGYIASRSRHNLGVAVDLTLVDLVTGKQLDMGTPYDTFSEAAHTANAGGRVLKHRQILVRAMASEGFTNYDKEWWHFSYSVSGARPFDEIIR
jgi:D-alanyl-D-alanine dipeptidase